MLFAILMTMIQSFQNLCIPISLQHTFCSILSRSKEVREPCTTHARIYSFLPQVTVSPDTTLPQGTNPVPRAVLDIIRPTATRGFVPSALTARLHAVLAADTPVIVTVSVWFSIFNCLGCGV